VSGWLTVALCKYGYHWLLLFAFALVAVRGCVSGILAFPKVHMNFRCRLLKVSVDRFYSRRLINVRKQWVIIVCDTLLAAWNSFLLSSLSRFDESWRFMSSFIISVNYMCLSLTSIFIMSLIFGWDLDHFVQLDFNIEMVSCWTSVM
jgi:hypothetical protein